MELITLDNGLKIALEFKADARSAAVCFDIAAGNRFEFRILLNIWFLKVLLPAHRKTLHVSRT